MNQRPEFQKKTPKAIGDKLIRIGSIAGSITAIILLIVMVLVASDKYGMTPAVQARSAPLIEKHEKNDSLKWRQNDRDHEEIRSLVHQEFKVIMVYTKAGMSEKALQKASDELVNDTTIAPGLKLQ
jgi:hypothetical protein